MARRIGDPTALATALDPPPVHRMPRVPSRWPNDGSARATRCTISPSASAIASSSCAPTSTACATGSSSATSRGVDADLAAVDRLVAELRQPQWPGNVPLLRAMRALSTGTSTRPSGSPSAPWRWRTRAEEPVAAQFYATQIGAAAAAAPLARGRRRSSTTLAGRLQELAEQLPGDPGVAQLARGDATPSSVTRARRERSSRRSPPSDFADVPLDAQWTISVTCSPRSRRVPRRRRPRARGSTSCCFPTTASS